MKFWVKAGLVSVVGFGLGIASVSLVHSSVGGSSSADAKPEEKVTELEWSTLRELDASSGKMSSSVQKLNGTKVRLPGFMIPLEDNQSDVSEFLLVPSPMACIHVPPPPANQIVHVRMAQGARAKMSYGPIWIQGKITVAESEGPFGKASYEMSGELTTPYE